MSSHIEGEIRNLRNIPSPASDVSVNVTYSPPLRTSRCLDYLKTDKRWLVELRFNSNYEIALFERFIIGTPIRLAEYQGKHDQSPRYFYIDSRIPNEATQEEVTRRISEELPSIGAAMAIQFPMFLPPIVRCIIDVEATLKGEGPWTEGGPTLILGTDSTPVIKKLLADRTDLLSPYLDKCSSDPDFLEAAMYCGQALGFRGGNPWTSLYRAFEIVRSRFGGDDGIVIKLRCCSKNRISSFTRTINHQRAIGKYSRHARLPDAPPNCPMTFQEAVEFTLSLLKAWREYSVEGETENA